MENIKKYSILFFTFIVIGSLISCMQEKGEFDSAHLGEFDTLIIDSDQYEAFSVKEASLIGNDIESDVFVIPTECITGYHSSKINYDAVYLLKQRENMIKIDVVYIDVISRSEKYAKVTGIKNGDTLLNIKKEINRLNSINNKELKKRFK